VVKHLTISVENLNLSYKKNIIFNNANWKPSKRIIGIIGKNGIGKSTLLKALSGRIPLENGRIAINNSSLDENTIQYLSSISSFIEPDSLYSNLTVKQNLKLLAYKVDKYEYIKHFFLDDLMKKKVGNLSMGQRHRVGLCISFINAKDIIVLDEPTNSLDFENILILREIIEKSVCNQIIIASHNLDFLSSISDEVFKIEENKIIKDQAISWFI